ncbi:sushi, von Willebrand factor type A, EGF and pentraxin domain-containing protein 1-like isoform X1 [Leucoraja erinacea]|uniref:sushi, von Willebrand factor type A, EGF and pentraxin domain-containing protein 1-like isoform X1 n=1 Tax=Leucoraja erinaceus TaxID=7782 RepID=UPI0024561A58|nr:sushi, von Willebrand factor type A, EGF and pentraxin domain-containing protein 1-like isoform X1 [Leucoraja erinacea]
MEWVLRSPLLLLCGTIVRSEETVNCGEPPRLENGFHIGNDFSFRQWLYYDCNKGYERFGSSRILCTHVGWSKFNIRCQIIRCGPPQPVANGTVLPRGEGTYGQQAVYSCNQGYTLTGERTITCTDTGHWSHPTPNCTEIKSTLPVRKPDSGESIKGSLQSNGVIIGGVIGAVAAVVVTAGLVALGAYFYNRNTRPDMIGTGSKVGEEPSISNDSSVTTPPQTYISPPLTTK